MSYLGLQARIQLELEREAEYKKEQALHKDKESSRNNFLKFVQYTKSDYKVNWHHKFMCDKLELFARGVIKKMMIFVPPQHGKSELASRRLPAYLLGINPNLRIAGASYSVPLATAFNLDIQRIIDSNEYHELYPNTLLGKSNVRRVSKNFVKRSAGLFEIADSTGSYRSVSIGGPLTGFKVDIAIIDDYIKDTMEAFSPIYRERVWNWYVNILRTRLHNNSQELIPVTRWHEDDLCGRLLIAEPSEWTVIRIPAVKEDDLMPEDPRQIGEALWEDEHDLKSILKIKTLSPKTFTSLYQQRPAPEEGDIFKTKWFKSFKASELPENIRRNVMNDTAYGKEKSDNSAGIQYSIHNNNLYLWNFYKKNLSFPDYIKWFKLFLLSNGYTPQDQNIYEPKATGISAVQQLKTEKFTGEEILKLIPADHPLYGKGINVIEDISPKDDKVTRAKTTSAIVEAGRVYLLDSVNWEEFLEEIKAFPNAKHDDLVDCLTGMLIREFFNKSEPSFRQLGAKKPSAG